MVKLDIYQKYTFYKNKGLSGLANLGNTCYMNCILQCISNTIPFTHHLLTFKFDNNLHPLVQMYIKTLVEIWKENTPVAPKSLKNCIDKFLPIFKGNDQHDAHEFFINIMEIFHNNLPLKEVYFEINKNANKYIKQAHISWTTHLKTPSLVSNLFYGQFCTVFRCIGCMFVHKVYEPFITLDVDIRKKDRYVSDHLKAYFTKDCVYIKCENCGSGDVNTEHDVERGFFKLPENLVISFKRFNNKHQKQIKNNNVVFIDNNLDLSEYSYISTDESVLYELKSIVCHIGNSLDGGHYFTLVKNENSWTCFNDSVVSTFNYDKLDLACPYMLFYTRKN